MIYNTTMLISKQLLKKVRTIGRLNVERPPTAERAVEFLVRHYENGLDETSRKFYESELEAGGLELEVDKIINPYDPEEQRRRASYPDVEPLIIRGRNNKRSDEEILRN